MEELICTVIEVCSNKPESVEHQADAYRLLFGKYFRTAIHAHNVYVL